MLVWGQAVIINECIYPLFANNKSGGSLRVYAPCKIFKLIERQVLCLPQKPIHKTNVAYGSPVFYSYGLAQPKQQFLPICHSRLRPLLKHSLQVATHFCWNDSSDENSSAFEATKFFLSIISAIVVMVVSFVLE